MLKESEPASIRAPLALDITDVVDSQLNPVANTGRTNDSELALTGTGTADAVVALYDNDADTGVTASVGNDGKWTLPVAAALGPHSYTAHDGAGADLLPWLLTVVPFERPAPVVIQAPGGVLNPIDALNGATVVVSYTVMIPTDLIGLSWNGLDNLVPAQPGNTLGSVTFTIPALAVAAVIGKTIPVIYTVVRKGVTLPSATLNLTVQTLPDSVLEAPRILQAPDDLNLDVSALSGDADLRVKPWPFIAAGQQISLRFEGTRVDGTAYNWPHPTWQDLTITSAGEPSTTVALSDLQELKDGSSLRLIFEVSFDGGLTKVKFPIRTLTVKARHFVSGYEDWQTTGDHIFALNVPFRSAKGLYVTLIKDVPGGYYTYVFNNFGDWALRVATGATVRLEFGGWITRISFDHYWGINNNWINCYDDKDNLIYVQEIVGQGHIDITTPRPCFWCWIAVYNASTGLAIPAFAWS